MKVHLLLVALLVFVACNSQSPKVADGIIDDGTLEGNTFSNQYFGFTLQIDPVWHILNKAELTQQMQERLDMLGASTGNTQSVAKGTRVLLSLTIDTLETMPQVLISSFDLNAFPHIKTAEDYLNDYFNQVKKMYSSYPVEITTSAIGKEAIGTKQFYTTLITIKAPNFLAYQKRYALKINNALLNFMVNYNTDNYVRECDRLLNHIQWK